MTLHEIGIDVTKKLWFFGLLQNTRKSESAGIVKAASVADILICCVASSVDAADRKSKKAPPVAPLPVLFWTRFYFGLDVSFLLKGDDANVHGVIAGASLSS